MELRRELQLGIGALAFFLILISFGAIGLFGRMTPVIERILNENVYSIEATEDLLALLALGDSLTSVEAEQRFSRALQRIRDNVTEEEERQPIEEIERLGRLALIGDPLARARTVEVLQELVQINRDAMQRVDNEAKRMGTAGAWSAVFLALTGFLLSMIVIHRTTRRVLEPFTELYATLEEVRNGDNFRRCRPLPAPLEVERILHSVNALLDQRMAATASQYQTLPEQDRAIALYLLDRHKEPVMVMTRQGAIALANTSGLRLLSSPVGAAVRQDMASLVEGHDPAREGLQAIHIPSSDLWMCSLTSVTS